MLNLHYKYTDTKVNNQINSLEKKYSTILKELYHVDDQIIFITYTIEDVVVGFLSYKIFDKNRDIYNIVVDCKYRSQKIGYKMISSLFEYSITLEVNENNKALLFYKNLGFKVYDRVENYYKNEACLKMIRRIDD